MQISRLITKHSRLLWILIVGMLACLVGVSTLGPKQVFAQGNADQAVELAGKWDRGEPLFKLVPQGYVRGCQRGSNDSDYKYKIDFGSLHGPIHPDRIYIHPHSNSVRRVIEARGGTFSGYNLTDRNNAYICIGQLAHLRGVNHTTVSLFHDQ
jgi:hypothetical protein